jgi:DNA-binding transcriptional ArsR family regulator
VLGHDTCVRLIDALSMGEATVSDLACRLQLDQPRVSTHLGLMREVGLVDCQATGRHRVYALRGPAPALAVATLRTLAASIGAGMTGGRSGPAGDPPAAAAQRATTTRPTARPGHDSTVRLARTCYDHLAGVAGVQMLDGMVARGWLQGDGREPLVTDVGAEALGRLGVNLPAVRRSRRAFALLCPDWTERRPHLGGALGAALLAAMLDQGRVGLRPAERAVDLQPGEPAPFLETGTAGPSSTVEATTARG